MGPWAPGHVLDVEAGRVLTRARGEEPKMDTIVPLQAVSKTYKVPMSRLTNRAWRRRVGLPAVKLGNRVLGVRADDLARCLRREFEPVQPTTTP